VEKDFGDFLKDIAAPRIGIPEFDKCGRRGGIFSKQIERFHDAGGASPAFNVSFDFEQALGKPRILFFSLVQAVDFPMDIEISHGW
jgi:hypothetical protein